MQYSGEFAIVLEEIFPRNALRYVIKIQVRLNGGHIPYLSSVTL